MQDNMPVPSSPSADDLDGHIVPSNGESSPSTQEAVLQGGGTTLKTVERVAFFLGLGWLLSSHLDRALVEQFVTPLAVTLNSVIIYLLAKVRRVIRISSIK